MSRQAWRNVLTKRPTKKMTKVFFAWRLDHLHVNASIDKQLSKDLGVYDISKLVIESVCKLLCLRHLSAESLMREKPDFRTQGQSSLCSWRETDAVIALFVCFFSCNKRVIRFRKQFPPMIFYSVRLCFEYCDSSEEEC